MDESTRDYTAVGGNPLCPPRPAVVRILLTLTLFAYFVMYSLPFWMEFMDKEDDYNVKNEDTWAMLMIVGDGVLGISALAVGVLFACRACGESTQTWLSIFFFLFVLGSVSTIIGRCGYTNDIWPSSYCILLETGDKIDQATCRALSLGSLLAEFVLLLTFFANCAVDIVRSGWLKPPPAAMSRTMLVVGIFMYGTFCVCYTYARIDCQGNDKCQNYRDTIAAGGGMSAFSAVLVQGLICIGLRNDALTWAARGFLLTSVIGMAVLFAGRCQEANLVYDSDRFNSKVKMMIIGRMVGEGLWLLTAVLYFIGSVFFGGETSSTGSAMGSRTGTGTSTKQGTTYPEQGAVDAEMAY